MTTELLAGTNPDTEVEQPPRTHKKYEGAGTLFVQFGMSCESGGIQEYVVLCRLHELLPSDIARPIDEITDEKGEYIGYEVEYIDGFPIDWSEATRKDVDHLRQIVRKIHDAGLAHGDLNAQNILRLADGTIKIIDPVGYDLANPQDIEVLQQHDLQLLKNFSDYVERARPRRIRSALSSAAAKLHNLMR